MRAEISATLKGRVEQDQEKVAKLIDVYSNMKPASASRVIETLNEDLAVTILDRMKKKNAAEILNMMSAQKAKKLSEMLTGYRQPASTAKTESD
jgi:flagellar motility protein MotE (MotC chaperone)